MVVSKEKLDEFVRMGLMTQGNIKDVLKDFSQKCEHAWVEVPDPSNPMTKTICSKCRSAQSETVG